MFLRKLSIFLCVFVIQADQSSKAVIIVPFVNALTQPVGFYRCWNQAMPVEEKYASLEYSPKSKNEAVGGRINQLVYGDSVVIVDEKDDQYCVLSMWKFNNDKMRCWVPKSSVLLITDENEKFYPKNIPFKNSSQLIITLQKPWKNEATKMEYPIGSRFIYTACEDESYLAYVNGLYVIIPQEYAQVEKKAVDCSVAKSTMVAFARKWAEQRYPYAQGGATADTTGQGSIFESTVCTKNHGEQGVYNRENGTGAGFDPAHANSRQALLSGLAIFAANTTQEKLDYEEIDISNKNVESGDIFWHSGYSYRIDRSPEGDFLIGARGYGAGYGDYSRLPIAACYKDMHTIEDLINAKKSNQQIILLNVRGEEQRCIEAKNYRFLDACKRQ